ncbi:MAG TPA: hypothetical protein DCR40_20635 [Prolixibacteraceae bacterium]|nr:hypothetical protein [Prolixibacteraceae bacterium]
MHQKGFLKKQTIQHPRQDMTSSIIGNSLLILGAILIVSSLMYLFFNLDKSDSLIFILVPIIILGVVLMIVSQFILPVQSRLRHRIGRRLKF